MVASLVAMLAVLQAGEIPAWSLEDCVALALRHSPAVQRVSAELLGAKGTRLGASSTLLPRVSLYGDMSRYSDRQVSFYQDQLKYSRERYSTGLQAELPLFDGWYGWSSVASAAAGVRAAQLRLRATRAAVAREVAEKFYAVLRAQALERVAAEAEQVSTRLLERAQERERVGASPRQEVLRATVQLYGDRLERMRRAHEVTAAKGALLLALGMAPDVAFTLEEPDDSLPPVPDLATCLGLAETHPSVEASREATEGARKEVRAARAAHYPHVSLSASWGWSDVEIPSDWERFRGFASWRVGLTMTVQLFDGLATRGRIQAAQAGVAQARARLQETLLALRHRVQVEHQRLVEALAQHQVAQAALALAQEEYRLAEERYVMGALSFVDLADSKLALERAKVNAVEAVFAVRLARVALAEATGTLEVGT